MQQFSLFQIILICPRLTKNYAATICFICLNTRRPAAASDQAEITNAAIYRRLDAGFQKTRRVANADVSPPSAFPSDRMPAPDSGDRAIPQRFFKSQDAAFFHHFRLVKDRSQPLNHIDLQDPCAGHEFSRHSCNRPEPKPKAPRD
ncbi:hypothetical protein [Burkholderia ambifaria]|uniref:hypothetical protein n=1 Tax=Burkholderia ambifaria TaxID=152480 RepID=UPI000A54152E|nr:hypothetical protein [Burkholderia ambifaria]